MSEALNNALALEGVSFFYGVSPVLEDVNLTVSKGDFASVVGPNGGGKTTLLKLILGMLRPDAGSVTVFGEAPHRSRGRVGYTPQYARYDPQFPVTVMEVVLMGRLERHRFWRYSRADTQAAREALAEVGLESLANASFAALSGGQRQRVLIARALVSGPDLLLLDEPTANVDVASETKLLDTLQELNKRMTILLVSHDLGFVAKAVRSVICVNHRVVVHPTSAITGEMIQDIYGGDVRMVRHDHRCSEEGHEHD